MGEYKILTINPGSTSTKIAVFKNEELLYEKTLRHSSEELTKYEKIAGECLEKQGYQILEYNFRCRYAEIDIVAKDGEYLVFCEVKFRKSGGLSAALEAVSVPKQMRLSGAAVYYLMKNGCTEIPCRFDVVGIAGNKISLRKNAFEYCGDFGIV